MIARKRHALLLAVVMGVAAVFISLTLLEMSPVLAMERAGTETAHLDPPAQPPSPPDDDGLFIQFIPIFTDPTPIQITDLSGNVIGEGVHEGIVRCNSDICSQQTQLQFTVPTTDWEYNFTIRQAIDPEAERVVVAGTGIISGRSQNETFSFIATFQNNRDGTVWVKYEASKPEASFIIPSTPGAFRISSTDQPETEDGSVEAVIVDFEFDGVVIALPDP